MLPSLLNEPSWGWHQSLRLSSTVNSWTDLYFLSLVLLGLLQECSLIKSRRMPGQNTLLHGKLLFLIFTTDSPHNPSNLLQEHRQLFYDHWLLLESRKFGFTVHFKKFLTVVVREGDTLSWHFWSPRRRYGTANSCILTYVFGVWAPRRKNWGYFRPRQANLIIECWKIGIYVPVKSAVLLSLICTGQAFSLVLFG